MAFAALATSFYTATCASQPTGLQILSVPYVPQASSWDCGLACVSMCLRAFGVEAPSLVSYQDLFPNQSVWTVDLAHMLCKFGLHVDYFTLTLGINPGFFLESYYEPMKADAIRIQRLFQEAEGEGIVMTQRSVLDYEIQSFLEGEAHVIIALVDKKLLETGLYHWTEGFKDASGSSVSYTGHYIVVCGYDRASDHYIIRDPDPRVSALGLCCISRSLFNAARKAFGTDEDLLLISAKKSNTDA